MKYYHGSPTKFIKEFHLETPRFESLEGLGIYITTDFNIAKEYAGEEGSVYVLEFSFDNILDATQREIFDSILINIGNDIEIDLLNIDYMDSTLENLINGKYQITDQYGNGISSQLRNLLLNDESVAMREDLDEIIDQVTGKLQNHFSEFAGIQYNDPQLGLVIVIKKPGILNIIEEL